MAAPGPHQLRRWVARAVVGGAAFGTVTSLSNHLDGPAWAYLSQLLDAAWTWVAVGLPGCLSFRRWRPSALLSATTLVAAVLAYDLTDLRYGGYTTLLPTDPRGPVGVDWMGLSGDVVSYLGIALVTAGGLATLVQLIRRGGALGLAAQLVVPAFAAWGSYRRVQDAYGPAAADAGLVIMNQAVTGVSVALILALLVRGVLRRAPAVPDDRL